MSGWCKFLILAQQQGGQNPAPPNPPSLQINWKQALVAALIGVIIAVLIGISNAVTSHILNRKRERLERERLKEETKKLRAERREKEALRDKAKAEEDHLKAQQDYLRLQADQLRLEAMQKAGQITSEQLDRWSKLNEASKELEKDRETLRRQLEDIDARIKAVQAQEDELAERRTKRQQRGQPDEQPKSNGNGKTK
jgi:mannitol-specific phosphotransferase system IIBC component